MREPSHFVFIQCDREQRAAIVQPGWCCQSSQSNTAGGGQASLSVTHTHTRTLTNTHKQTLPLMLTLGSSQTVPWLGLPETGCLFIPQNIIIITSSDVVDSVFSSITLKGWFAQTCKMKKGLFFPHSCRSMSLKHLSH